MPYPRGWRRPLPEREHCLGDFAGRRIGDRGGGLIENEQPRPGDLAGDRLAVADGEERVAAAVARVDEHGRAVIVPNALGQPITPSEIAFTADPPLVGEEAKLQQAAGEPNVASFFKRSMGDPSFVLTFGVPAVKVCSLRAQEAVPLYPPVIKVGRGRVLLGVATLGPLSSLSWIAAYWPLALVLLGVWLLFRESLPQPIRRPLATLGGVALLGYGVVAAAASVAAGGAFERNGAVPSFGSSPFADTQTLDMPIQAGQTLTINNANGSTTVHSGVGSSVHVAASRHFSVGGQPPDVQLQPDADGLSLGSSTTGRDRFPFGDSSRVDYSVDVPSGVGVNVQSSSGSVDLADISGDVRMTTSSGSIRGIHLQHLKQAQSSSGTISLEGVFTDSAEIKASSGSIDLTLLPGSAVQLDAHTSSGSIEPHGELVLNGGVTQRRALTGVLGTPAPGAILSIQTTSGSVSIRQ